MRNFLALTLFDLIPTSMAHNIREETNVKKNIMSRASLALLARNKC